MRGEGWIYCQPETARRPSKGADANILRQVRDELPLMRAGATGAEAPVAGLESGDLPVATFFADYLQEELCI